MKTHTFTSSKTGTFGFCISYLTFVVWSQYNVGIRLGNAVVRVTTAVQETP